tara:strand:+ start:15426 stop:15839 length:414 start_codon:yes stop_codon:yes gene_type:complete
MNYYGAYKYNIKQKMKLAIQLLKEQNTIRLLANNKDNQISFIELCENEINISSVNNFKLSTSLLKINFIENNNLLLKTKKIKFKCKNFNLVSNEKINIKKDIYNIDISSYKIKAYFKNIKINTNKFKLTAPIINFLV